MSMALDFQEKRICVVDCGKESPECKCRPRNLALERARFERMIATTSQASQEYNLGKLRIISVDV
jgi:hypothetical protein